MTDVNKHSRLFADWKGTIKDSGGVMRFTLVYFHGNNIFPR